MERDDAAETDTRFRSWTPTEPELIEWEARPAMNESVRWSVTVNGGSPMLVGPCRQKQHIGLRIQWNERRPDRMRVNLSRSSLREICSRSAGRVLFLEDMPVGCHVRIAFEA